jgi:cytochrome P450
MLRYEPSVPFTVRVAAEDFLIDGQQIRRGKPVCLYVAAANRDPAIFTDPETFDTTRNPNPHLAFGRGIHICWARRSRGPRGRLRSGPCSGVFAT